MIGKLQLNVHTKLKGLTGKSFIYKAMYKLVTSCTSLPRNSNSLVNQSLWCNSPTQNKARYLPRAR